MNKEHSENDRLDKIKASLPNTNESTITKIIEGVQEYPENNQKNIDTIPHNNINTEDSFIKEISSVHENPFKLSETQLKNELEIPKNILTEDDMELPNFGKTKTEKNSLTKSPKNK
jgi:hypothetical protein